MKRFARIALAALTLAAALAATAGAEELEDGTQGAVYHDDRPQVEDAAPTATPVVGVSAIVEELDRPQGPQGAIIATPNPGGAWVSDDAGKLDPSYGVDSGVDEAGRFTSPGALYRHWNSEGWPETVGDMWSLDGTMDRMVVAVVDGNETVMADIRAMMADPDSLEFASCRYSHAQLEQVQYEIEIEIKQGAKCILGVGRAVRGNDFSVNGEPVVRVTVSTLYDGAEEWAATLRERYGDMLELEVGDIDVKAAQETVLTGMGQPEELGGRGSDQGAPAWYLWLLPVAGLGLLGLELVRRQALSLRTADGHTVAAGGRVSRAQAEQAVREAAAVPGEAGWEALKQKLD